MERSARVDAFCNLTTQMEASRLRKARKRAHAPFWRDLWTCLRAFRNLEDAFCNLTTQMEASRLRKARKRAHAPFWRDLWTCGAAHTGHGEGFFHNARGFFC